MKVLVVAIFIISPLLANAARLTLKTSLNTRALTATSKANGDEGKIEGQGNFHYGLAIESSLSKNFRWGFGGEIKNYSFDNEDDVIAGEERVETIDSYIGFKWIMFSRSALRFDFHYEEDIAFTINGDNEAELFKEGITYIDANFDQILYLSPRFYFGFKVGTELLMSSDELITRDEIHYGLFMNFNTIIGVIEISGEYKSVKKDIDTLDFEQEDISMFLDYTVRF